MLEQLLRGVRRQWPQTQPNQQLDTPNHNLAKQTIRWPSKPANRPFSRSANTYGRAGGERRTSERGHKANQTNNNFAPITINLGTKAIAWPPKRHLLKSLYKPFAC
mmetsp:Transcript_19389/g.41926  ORF Transcript_19389/g.41926 Transcript_19389/m.41926 type:complete len:106 (-) Transcript_19389:2158-2475(-)